MAADAVAPWRGPAAAQRAGRTTIAAPAARDAAAGPPAFCSARGAAGRLGPRRAPPDATSKGPRGRRRRKGGPRGAAGGDHTKLHSDRRDGERQRPHGQVHARLRGRRARALQAPAHEFRAHRRQRRQGCAAPRGAVGRGDGVGARARAALAQRAAGNHHGSAQQHARGGDRAAITQGAPVALPPLRIQDPRQAPRAVHISRWMRTPGRRRFSKGRAREVGAGRPRKSGAVESLVFARRAGPLRRGRVPALYKRAARLGRPGGL